MRTLIFVASVGFAAITCATAAGRGQESELARATLPPGDGWASSTTGTTGGAAATPERVFTVTNRQELVSALAIGTVPKIIQVRGTIDANVDNAGTPLTCASYADPVYSIEAYLQAYDPAPDKWGRRAPSGPLEDARRRSQQNQQARVRINVTANTTLIGLGSDARIVGAHVRINNVDNVIVRNITFQDAHDCFPAWDPLDGSTGNWNSQYDNISLTMATHVWVDHCTFNDGDNPDSGLPVYFGRLFQVHDGLLDITNASDLVTVTWNRFADHDKVMLIGSSDSATADRGKLNVTLHHNLFARLNQRAPRVRFGQVHVYNNLYDVDNPEGYSYSWGVGVESKLYAEDNFFRTAPGITPDRLIRRFSGTAIHVGDTLLNGHSKHDHAALLEAYNAANEPDLSSNVNWTPSLDGVRHPPQALPGVVEHNAGVFK